MITVRFFYQLLQTIFLWFNTIFEEWLERRHGVLTYRLTQVLTGHSKLEKFLCRWQGGAHGGGVPCLGGAPPCPRGGDRRRRPLAPRTGRSHGARRPGGVGGRHLLLRSSDASEGGGGAFAGAPCCRLTLSSPPYEETPGPTDVAGRSPATVGAGLRAVSSG